MAGIAAGLVVAWRAADAPGPDPPARAAPPPGKAAAKPTRTLQIRVTRLARLSAPVQDAAAAVAGTHVYLFGGLTPSDTSTGVISEITGSSVRMAGRLPVPIHDAGASVEGHALYVFGGGQLASEAGIARFTPSNGKTRLVGSLPTALSDTAVAAVAGTPYAIGGYTGSAWSDRIYALSGGHAHQAGRLPAGLRYAAAASLGDSIIIAGGRGVAGPTRAIYRFTPATGRTTRIGRLPQPLMHAAAGTLGGVVYVVGGIAGDGHPTRSIVAIHPDGSTTLAARLPHRLSDAAVATLHDHLLVAGGNTGHGETASVLQVALHSVKAGPSSRPSQSDPNPSTAARLKMYNGALPGDLLIADRGNNRILLVNPRGRVLWRFPNGHSHLHLYFDDDTFFSPGGRAIISNQEENHQIVEIGYPSGRLRWSYGHPGTAGASAGYLNTPDDAYRLRNGLVIVADAYNCRVLEITRRTDRPIDRPGRPLRPRSSALAGRGQRRHPHSPRTDPRLRDRRLIHR